MCKAALRSYCADDAKLMAIVAVIRCHSGSLLLGLGVLRAPSPTMGDV